MLLGLWAALGSGADAVEVEERPGGLAAGPIVRVSVPPARDEPFDAEAARAQRAALELPPRLVPEPMTAASAARASARVDASSSDAPLRLESGAPGGAEARDRPPGGEEPAPRDAATATDGTPARTSAHVAGDAPSEEVRAALTFGPDRSPPAGSDEAVPAIHAAAFSSGRDDPVGFESEAEAEEPAGTVSRASEAKPAPRRDEGGLHELRTETLSVVLSDFRPRPATTHGGREGRAGDRSRPGLARPSGSRAGSGSTSTAREKPPREASDVRDDAARDWKLSRGRWGLERGGRLSMDLDSGYRLSLKPRRSGLVLSIRRNF